jgi:hypothetical protein
MLQRKSLISGALLIVALSTSLATAAEASTICVVGYCDIGEVPSVGSVVFISGPYISAGPSNIELIPYQNQNGWNYSFMVSGTDIVSASIPYFGGWSPSQVSMPDGWIYQINAATSQQSETANWSKSASTPAGYYSIGASFTSEFAPSIATLSISQTDGSVIDIQVFTPLTPSALSAGYSAASLPVPEPSSAILGIFGIALLSASLRFRKR